MFPEYQAAIDELSIVMAEEKKKIALKIRPLYFKSFEDFFEKNPEIAQVSFTIETGCYNDEDYYDDVTNFRYKLRSDLLPDDYPDDEDDSDIDYSVLAGPSDWTRQYARGEFDSWARGYYSPVRLEQMTVEAQEKIEAWDAFIDRIGTVRVKELFNDVRNLAEFINGTDIEFLKTVLGEDVSVKVTKEGFTVES